MSQLYASIAVLAILQLVLYLAEGSRVLELSDRFLDIGKEGMWFVMFYAPWCAHCKKLDPIWNQVAQSMYSTPVRVGRVDCTRYSNVASEYSVKGFPTILFIKNNEIFTYGGDRTRDEIVDFAHRLSGPAVRSIEKPEELNNTITKHNIFFMFIGEDQESPLWFFYKINAEIFLTTTYFYYAPPAVMNEEIDAKELPMILAFKDDTYTVFDSSNSEDVNITLYNWINKERFVLFTKITHGNFNQVLMTEKNLVVAVLEETKIGQLLPEMKKFKDDLYSIAKKHDDKFHETFQFCWLGQPEIANSIAMEMLPIPSLIVINSSTFQHYIPEDEPNQLTEDVIVSFLDQILNESATAYGGNSLPVRIYRMYYEGKTALFDMWRGNPVLTAVLFGMPLGFLSLLCYSICCSDIMEASEEEEMLELERKHVKKE